jgi:hypothetical protein
MINAYVYVYVKAYAYIKNIFLYLGHV